MNVVVDCSVLEVCCDFQDKRFLGGLALLWRIAECHSIVLDHERFIGGQYRLRALSVPYVDQWFQKLVYRRGVEYTSGKLTKRDRLTLTAAKFHQDDWAYLGVAKRLAAPVIHEDSDYEGPGPAELGVGESRILAALSSVPECPNASATQ